METKRKFPRFYLMSKGIIFGSFHVTEENKVFLYLKFGEMAALGSTDSDGLRGRSMEGQGRREQRTLSWQ